jgi:excisionase family DNA binding protein
MSTASETISATVKDPSWRKPAGRRGRLPEGEQRLVGVDAAAKMLGVSTNYAYKMIRAGDLGAVDLGKRTLVKVAEIDSLIERKTRRPVATAA